jgi:glycosyltransferase involved in cell wall biosynthesis
VKISIITPSFNQGRFLQDCVESVLSQVDVIKERRNPSADDHESAMRGAKLNPTAAHGQGESDFAPPCFTFEHIVTDAGSTDDTLEVLARYPHLKWTSEPDAGMSDGINKGFLKATGDWVMWLNCDDYLLPGALAKVVEFIRQHPEVDVLHGDCVFVGEDKTVIRRKYDHPVDESTLLFVGCFIPSTSTFFKRRIIDAGNLLDTSYKVCMDWEYYLRLIRRGFKFGYLPEALAGFRWHGTNTSLVHLKRGNDEAQTLQRQHMAERHMNPILAKSWVLRILRRVFQVRRIIQRIAVHGRVR